MGPRKQPAWTKDECILALDLYFRLEPARLSPDDPAVVELSNLLRRLPHHLDRGDPTLFRNPNGVQMTLLNFRYLDTGRGLSAVSRMARDVYNQFRNDRNRLHRIARTIREIIPRISHEDLLRLNVLKGGASIPEGETLLAMHLLSEEVSQSDKELCKMRAILRDGCLQCEVCGFAPLESFGPLGEVVIEYHNTLPVLQIPRRFRRGADRLVVVCANCHRVLHSMGMDVSVQQLREMVYGRSRSGD